MYQTFIAFEDVENDTNLKDLFMRRMQASENHLSAFRKNLEKY